MPDRIGMIKYLFALSAIMFGLLMAAPGDAYSMDDRVVNIVVTSQKNDYSSPWQKGEIVRSNVTGCVIEGNKILTVAYSITDHVIIEVMKKGESRKYQADVFIKDYHCGLALLSVKDAGFFNGLKPVDFAPAGKITARSAKVYRWDSLSSLKEYPADLTKSSIRFYEPSCAVLMHQFSTSMNDGGNGEPVFIDGKLAGVTTGLNTETKTLYVLGIDVIRRMLKDAEDGDYRGVPFFWVDSMDIKSDINLREYFGVSPGDGGVLVTDVPSISSAGDVLRKNDIIQTIDGRSIDDSGMYDSPYGKLYYYGLIQLDRHVGDTVSMDILRDKKKTTINFKLKPIPTDCCVIPLISHDREPFYYQFGGLVFQELTTGYLESFGRDWKQKANKRLLFYYDSVRSLAERGPDARVLVLTRVLPDTVNKGYQYYKDLVLENVNGEKVLNLAHLKRIIESCAKDYIVLDFVGKTTVVLDRKKAISIERELMKTYNVTAPYNIPGTK
jgi:hypothetical protein